MHENTLYKLRKEVDHGRAGAAGSGYIPMPGLYAQKAQRRAKARTFLHIVGGLSWIAGLLLLLWTAAGIEQDKLGGWQLIVSAAVGLGLLGFTAAVSSQERNEEDV